MSDAEFTTFHTNRTGSVRMKVQNFEDKEHYFGKDFYSWCLYLGEDGDPEKVEDGYLRSALLMKVLSRYKILLHICSFGPQTFKAIFTLPLSASEDPGHITQPTK